MNTMQTRGRKRLPTPRSADIGFAIPALCRVARLRTESRPETLLRRVGANAATAVVALAVMLALSCSAGATDQEPERIRIAGREYRLYSAPLEPWLDAHPTCSYRLEAQSTSLARSYRGTWAIRDGRLELLELAGDPWSGSGGTERGGQSVPLKPSFFAPGPIWATWYTGPLAVSLGLGAANVEQDAPARLIERVAETWVDRGRVSGTWRTGPVGRRSHFMRRAAWSPAWAGLENLWLDVRTILAAGAAPCLLGGGDVRVRGLLANHRDERAAWLHAPTRAGQPSKRLLLRLGDGVEVPEPASAAVEVGGNLAKIAGRLVLVSQDVTGLLPEALLEHGPLPAMADWRFYTVSPEERVIDSEDQPLEEHLGARVVIEGNVARSGPIGVLNGVVVNAQAAQSGKRAYALGVLQKWVVTEDVGLRELGVLAPMATRRPVVIWCVVEPDGRRLAMAQHLPSRREAQSKHDNDREGSR